MGTKQDIARGYFKVDTPSERHGEQHADCLVDSLVAKLIELQVIPSSEPCRAVDMELRRVAATYLEDAHEAGIDYACRAFTEALPRDVRDGMPEDGR